jgi:hypothetical protein
LCCDRNKGGEGFKAVVGDLRKEAKELVSERCEWDTADVELVALNKCEKEPIGATELSERHIRAGATEEAPLLAPEDDPFNIGGSRIRKFKPLRQN